MFPRNLGFSRVYAGSKNYSQGNVEANPNPNVDFSMITNPNPNRLSLASFSAGRLQKSVGVDHSS